MREVTAPDCEHWEVFLEWEGRKPLSRSFRRLRGYREARAKKRTENASDSLLDGCDLLSSIDADLSIVAVVMVLILLFVLFGPVLFLALFGIVEIGLLIVAVVVGLTWRTLARRPWRIAAVSQDGELWAWNRTGFWRSRALVHTVADQLKQGATPQLVEPELLESPTPSVLPDDPYVGPTAQPAIRWLSAVVALGAFAGIVLTIVDKF